MRPLDTANASASGWARLTVQTLPFTKTVATAGGIGADGSKTRHDKRHVIAEHSWNELGSGRGSVDGGHASDGAHPRETKNGRDPPFSPVDLFFLLARPYPGAIV